MVRYLCTTLLCALWVLFSAGCLEGYSSDGSRSSLSSKSPAAAGGNSSGEFINSPYDLSGNGEGYGGVISGNYYSFSPVVCDHLVNNVGSSPAYLKSIVEKTAAQAVLNADFCQQMPSQTFVPDASIFSATHNSNILLLENGDVHERHADDSTASSSRQLEMFCRGKRVYYGGNNSSFTGIHYQQGISGFRPGPVRDDLWVDFIVRHRAIPVDNQYDGELVFESLNQAGDLIINVLREFDVDQMNRTRSTDFLSEFGVIGVDPSTNTNGIFFEGKMTLNLPSVGMVQADMVCTRGIK